MALPLAPIAATALRWGVVAALAYAVTRYRGRAPADPRRDAAIDPAPDGLDLEFRHQPGEARADGSLRLRRTIRAGRRGPGFELDLAALGRAKLRPIRGGC